MPPYNFYLPKTLSSVELKSMLINPEERPKTYCSLANRIAGNPEIETIIGAPVRHIRFGFQVKNTDTLLCWGRSPIYLASSERLARRKNIPINYLEDGFICYSKPPSAGGIRFSLIVDDLGIYYDATRPSRLENLIRESCQLDATIFARAKQLRLDILEKRASKYNHQGFSISKQLEEKLMAAQSKVLVVDQTRNDASIKYGLAGRHSFKKMLEDAIAENRGSTIFVKVHPDIKLGVKKGHFTPSNYNHLPNVVFIEEDCNPHHLLSLVDEVYVVSSQMGFEALMHNLPVHTYGMPFYAGWGLTDDQIATPERRVNSMRTIEQLIYATLIRYPRYNTRGAESLIDSITE